MDFKKNHFYHIFNRGNNSQKVFFNRENYLFFLRKMKKQIHPFASIVSWCLMPNHFHFVIFVNEDKIKVENSHKGDQDFQESKYQTLNQSLVVLLSSYTKAIQKQEKITGSLFQKRTKAKLIIDEIEIEPSYWNTTFGTLINIPEGESYLQTCIRYIHQNPVNSGVVKTAGDWEFSSFRDYVGLRRGALINYSLLLNENLIDGSIRHPKTSRETKTKNLCIIGIGSNLDAKTNIAKMLDILQEKVKVLQVSTLLKTKPIGIKDQPDFTNGAVKIETSLSRNKLNELLKNIEDELGRDRTVAKFGPRCIDLDIAVWNGKIVDKDYYTRDFLKQSVKELS